jgi:hypothetical protein
MMQSPGPQAVWLARAGPGPGWAPNSNSKLALSETRAASRDARARSLGARRGNAEHTIGQLVRPVHWQVKFHSRSH